jgi:hypothetical protein
MLCIEAGCQCQGGVVFTCCVLQPCNRAGAMQVAKPVIMKPSSFVLLVAALAPQTRRGVRA